MTIFYVFLQKRPQDKQAWPTVYVNKELAEKCPFRCSAIVEVSLAELIP